MKRLLLLVLVVPLLVVSSAEAKGLKWVEVCGPTECNRERDLDFAQYPLVFPPWVLSGLPDRPPTEAAPWLQVRVAFGQPRRVVESIAVPRIGYAGGDQEGQNYGWVWQELSRAERRTYLHLGSGLARFPAETMPGLD